ncbi:MAG: ketoacyl-ACP synthase III [Kiritimatiellae bacterium]|nr:ketoacyl-ACP synthase III [Kiritimatiellia bacterium]
MLRPVAIAGVGSYVPARVMTNHDLERIVNTTHEWIVTRTGMRERRIAADHEATSDLASVAGRRALEAAGVVPADVDMIVVATITPDYPFPNTACLVQRRLGAERAFCMGLEAACSGFLYAMETARWHIAAGAVETALVIGAEKMSAVLDWSDRSTCVLFGDGAGAAVLRPAPPGRRGILSSVLGSDGSLSELLMVPAGGSRRPTTAETVAAREHYLRMRGREVFRHAVTHMADAALAALKRAGLTMADIRWVIPHQANLRIIAAIGEKLHCGAERFIVNVEKYGNTSAASIGLALDEAVRDGRIRDGDLVLMVAFGAGFTWGATVMEWTSRT